MPSVTRRQFLASLGAAGLTSLLGTGPKHRTPGASVQGPPYHVYVARNGTPFTNVQRVVALAGGIQSFIGYSDAVVLKPNGQWPLQGYTHTQCLKALIDLILGRPGGFGGEIIIAEHVHRSPSEALNGNYCWNMSTGYNRTNNWPDMNYLELVADYQSRNIFNVTAIPFYDSGQSTDWVTATGPGNVPAYVDRSADLPRAAKYIVASKAFDHSVICATEQSVVADRPIAARREELMKAEVLISLTIRSSRSWQRICLQGICQIQRRSDGVRSSSRRCTDSVSLIGRGFWS